MCIINSVRADRNTLKFLKKSDDVTVWILYKLQAKSVRTVQCNCSSRVKWQFSFGGSVFRHDAPHGLKLMFFYTNHTFKIHEHDLYPEHSIIVCNVVILHITATFTSVSEYLSSNSSSSWFFRAVNISLSSSNCICGFLIDNCHIFRSLLYFDLNSVFSQLKNSYSVFFMFLFLQRLLLTCTDNSIWRQAAVSALARFNLSPGGVRSRFQNKIVNVQDVQINRFRLGKTPSADEDCEMWMKASEKQVSSDSVCKY